MRALDLDKPSQGVDYELVPAYAQDDSQTWEVMILRAPFDGSRIRYKNVQLDGEGEELQQFCTDILIDVIELAIKDGSIGAASDGNQSTTDDSTESID